DGYVDECGGWRGGLIGEMADVLNGDRKYYLFDSFEGLPKAREIDGESAINWQKDTKSPIYFDNCSAEIKYAEDAMKKSKVKDYQIIKGWFNETLPPFIPAQRIAVLRLDSDWYDSTMVCLNNLYKNVAKGGVIIIDDYYTWDGCTKAVHDFLSQNKIPDRIRTENDICYIIKN
ncbi:MAG: TylF/MycF/NovP-related O-methyltransferase, partial [bacterium]